MLISGVNLWQSNQSDSAYNSDDHSCQDKEISQTLNKKKRNKIKIVLKINYAYALGVSIHTHS